MVVDEARRSLGAEIERGPAGSVKSFDYLVTGADGANLLVEVKGRRLAALRGGRPSLQNWVSREDIDGLRRWRTWMGEGFEAIFVFVYWSVEQPPDGLFEDLLAWRGLWYGFVGAPVEAYSQRMRVRSTRWDTVHLSARDFDALRRPLTVPCGHRAPLLC